MIFTQDTIDAYAQMVGDTNPVHEGDRAIVHAGLLMGLACAEAAKLRPGWVCALVEMKFLRPFVADEEILADVIPGGRMVGGLSVDVHLNGSSRGIAAVAILLMEPR